AERAAALLSDCMTRAFAAVFPNAPLNGLVEQKITDAWGSKPPQQPAPAKPAASAVEFKASQQPSVPQWCVGQQTIIQADCFEQLARMQPGSIHVVVTSPRYNIGIGYNSHRDKTS